MYITNKAIDINHYFAQCHSAKSGAVVLFSGEVRGLNEGKEVEYLEYEAYEDMANPAIEAILNEAKAKWRLNHITCIHRTGKVTLTECAVLIITTSAHRSDAYTANRFIIDKVKATVPIWKKEVYTDGSHTWGSNCECHHHTHKNISL